MGSRAAVGRLGPYTGGRVGHKWRSGGEQCRGAVEEQEKRQRCLRSSDKPLEGRKQASKLSWFGERGALFFCWDLSVLGVPRGCFSGSNKGPVMARGTLLLGSAGGCCPSPGVGDRAHFCCTDFMIL